MRMRLPQNALYKFLSVMMIIIIATTTTTKREVVQHHIFHIKLESGVL